MIGEFLAWFLIMVWLIGEVGFWVYLGYEYLDGSEWLFIIVFHIALVFAPIMGWQAIINGKKISIL